MGVEVAASFQDPHMVHQRLSLRSHRYTAHAACHVIFRPFRGDCFTFICLYVNTVFKLVTFI